jgi:hypothetical protein
MRKGLVRPCLLSPRGSRAIAVALRWPLRARLPRRGLCFLPGWWDLVCARTRGMPDCAVCPPTNSFPFTLSCRAGMLLVVLTHAFYERCSLRGTGLLSFTPLPLLTPCLPHCLVRPEVNSYDHGVPPGRSIPFQQPLAQFTEAVSSLFIMELANLLARQVWLLEFFRNT